MRLLQGYKTYISAGAIVLLAVAGLVGSDPAAIAEQADKLASAALAIFAIYGRWDKERRSIDVTE